MVAQAGNGLVLGQFAQAGGDFSHGDGSELKPLGPHTGGLQFPGLAHVQYQGLGAIVGSDPVMRFTVIQRKGDRFETTSPWDTIAPRLVNFPEPSSFSF